MQTPVSCVKVLRFVCSPSTLTTSQRNQNDTKTYSSTYSKNINTEHNPGSIYVPRKMYLAKQISSISTHFLGDMVKCQRSKMLIMHQSQLSYTSILFQLCLSFKLICSCICVPCRANPWAFRFSSHIKPGAKILHPEFLMSEALCAQGSK